MFTNTKNRYKIVYVNTKKRTREIRFIIAADGDIRWNETNMTISGTHHNGEYWKFPWVLGVFWKKRLTGETA